jgi:hypothetical protein
MMLWVAVASPVAVWASGPEGAPEEEAATLLRHCLQAQSRMDHVSMQVVTDMNLEPLFGRPCEQRVECLFRRDGDRLDVSGRYLFLDKQQDRSTKFRTIIGEKYYIDYDYRFGKVNGPKGGIVSEDRPAYLERFARTFCHGAALDGDLILSGRKRLAELLLDAKDRRLRGEETVGGVPCKVVEGSTPYGKIALWIARTQGFITLKVVYQKAGDDLYEDGKPISRQSPYLVAEGDERPIEGCRVVVDDVVAREVQKGVYVPVAGRLVETVSLGGGKDIVTTYRYQRSDIILSPRFEGTDAFKTDLPDNVVVTNLDDKESGVVYKWRDGRVIAAYSDFVMTGEGFKNDPRPLGYFILVNGSLLFIAVMLLYWDRWNKRRMGMESQGHSEGHDDGSVSEL